MAYLHDGEDGGEGGAGDEDEEEDAMELLVAFGIEDGEEDEACAADEGPGNREAREDLLSRMHVREEPGEVESVSVSNISVFRS